jgi:hypothetical protein
MPSVYDEDMLRRQEECKEALPKGEPVVATVPQIYRREEPFLVLTALEPQPEKLFPI